MQLSPQEITVIFQAEQVAKPKVYALDDVPGTYEAITTEWLTAVLCRGTPGAQVTDFRIADRSDGSSNRARIHLDYNAAGQRAGLPKSVFCKGAMTLRNRVLMVLTGGGFAETTIFLKVRDRLGIETPKHIHAAYNPDTFAYIIVMEDLGGTAHFCDETDTHITRAQAEKIVNTLATLHAKYYESMELATLPLKRWKDFWSITKSNFNGWDDACDKAFGLAESVIPPRLFRRRAEIIPATEASVLRLDKLPKTLLHCDVHLNNWYIAGNGDMGLTDWQFVATGHWSRDLVYALVTTLSVDDRRAWFDDLVRLYLDKLVEYGTPRASFDDTLLNLRQQLMSTLSFWTLTIVPAPDMPRTAHSDARCLEMIKRIATAIDDMDALGAFR